MGLCPRGEYECGACKGADPAAPVEPGVCGRTPLGVFGATNGEDDKVVRASEFLGDAAAGGRYGVCCREVAYGAYSGG